MQLTVEFGGGLELLCDSVKIHNVKVDVPNGAEKLTMRDFLVWVLKNLIKERPEMFVKGDTVRPGVLVLVNDCDWELSGQLETTLEEKDVVVFISTLHGGFDFGKLPSDEFENTDHWIISMECEKHCVPNPS